MSVRSLLASTILCILLAACSQPSNAPKAVMTGASPAPWVQSSPGVIQSLSILQGSNYLSDQNPLSATNGYGPYEKDKSNNGAAAGDGNTLTLNGVTYPKGLGVHADSELVYDTFGYCTSFTASVGVDDEVGNLGSVTFRVYADAETVPLFDSGVMTGSTATKAVNVNITGKRKLRLVVDSGGNGDNDHADWAAAQLGGCRADINVGQNYLSDLNPVTATNGYGPYERDRSNNGGTAGDGNVLTLNSVTFAKGLGVHANSDLVYNIGAQCQNFTAKIGVDDEVGSAGAVAFRVYADGLKIFDSGTMTGSSTTQTINVDVKGVERLELVVDNLGDSSSDHADWADAKIGGCIVYDAPIVITRPDTYVGNWRSNAYNQPAVLIATTGVVIIQNSNIASKGNGIAWRTGDGSGTNGSGIAGTDVTVKNSHFYGLNPDTDGIAVGRAVSIDFSKNIVFENNEINNSGGVYINGFDGAQASRNGSLSVRFNRANNITGRVSSGVGTYRSSLISMGTGQGSLPSGGFVPAQFFQLNNSSAQPRVEVAWNKVINQPYKSRVEDNINFDYSSGTASSPILIHDNLINGAYAIAPGSDYSGGGIFLGDGCGAAYVEAYGNTVIETSNYGMAVGSGHHMSIHDNTVLGLGMVGGGSNPVYLDSGPDYGIYLRHYCTTETNQYTTVNASNNKVGWNTPNTQNPQRNLTNNVGSTSDNTYAQTGTLGTNTEVAQSDVANQIPVAVSAWETRANSSGIVVGTF